MVPGISRTDPGLWLDNRLGLVLIREGDPQRLIELARERGVLLLTAGKDCVRLVPSLNVSEEEVSHAVDVIESCLSLLLS